MAEIVWTKEWSSSDDGTIVSGQDLANIQSDIGVGVTTNAESLQGVPVEAPEASDDDKVLVYDHSNLKFDYFELTSDIPLSYLDTDDTLAADSDTKVPSQQATKAYVDNKISDMPTGIEGSETTLTATHSYGPTAAGAYWYMSMGKNSSGEFVMASGYENTGVAIPLPTDCAQEDCHWIVSVKWAQSAGFAWTGFTTSIDSSRVVTIRNEGYNWVA